MRMVHIFLDFLESLLEYKYIEVHTNQWHKHDLAYLPNRKESLHGAVATPIALLLLLNLPNLFIAINPSAHSQSFLLIISGERCKSEMAFLISLFSQSSI